eukprot:CAMPEP_0177688834 /NCGR_PEP_ID=MMETSP0447-20121125/34857_1 /TAXON_ID=0 /ORGANISM="Stygamoeba regulata, Strain BSH-02190019" /LENGTH=654 /DNA_ID=CAMNT_0019199137 /DNA_START=203 /DNA_END=2164 /DNA_ORIENTATION=+
MQSDEESADSESIPSSSSSSRSSRSSSSASSRSLSSTSSSSADSSESSGGRKKRMRLLPEDEPLDATSLSPSPQIDLTPRPAQLQDSEPHAHSLCASPALSSLASSLTSSRPACTLAVAASSSSSSSSLSSSCSASLLSAQQRCSSPIAFLTCSQCACTLDVSVDETRSLARAHRLKPSDLAPDFEDDWDVMLFSKDVFSSSLHWRKVPVRKGRMPSARCWAALCAVKENLVLIGGYDINTPYPNDMHVFNTHTSTWRRLSFLPTDAPRYAHTLTYVNDKLLVFGGDSVNGYLDDVYLIDNDFTSSRQVEMKGQGPTPRAAPATAVVGKKLFFFGGDSGTEGGYRHDLFILHTDTMAWQEITSDVTGQAPEARGWHSMSAVDHRLFVFGGYNGSTPFQDLHVLDTETMVWSQPQTHGAAPSPRYSHTAVVHGNFILLIGGANGTKSFDECYVLNTDTFTWIRPSMTGSVPPPRHGHNAVAMETDHKVYTFGGYDLQEVFDSFDMISLEYNPSIQAPTSTVSKDIGRLLGDTSTSDVYLIVGEQSIAAHKLILQARSTFFRALFHKNPTLQQIVLEIPPSLVQSVVTFIYTGELEVTDGTALALLQVAKRYELPDLVRLCECALECTMDVSNAAALYELATLYEAKALQKACIFW